jgi:hypothetical protein
MKKSRQTKQSKTATYYRIEEGLGQPGNCSWSMGLFKEIIW